MKINQNNRLYIQRIDLLYIYESFSVIPASIYERTIKKKHFITDKNKYEFIEFTNPDEISYLDSIDWIIDYNEVKELKPEEILQLDKEIASQEIELIAKIRNMNNEDISNNLNMISKHHQIQLKRQSLRDVLWYKLGYINMTLPKEVPTKKLEKKK